MNTLGLQLPESLQTILDVLKIKDASYRNYRHWVGRSENAFYKLASKDSLGQMQIRLEGEILQKLKHPGVVSGRLIDDGNWEILKVDAIQGVTLTTILDRLSTDEKMRILAGLEDIIEYINGNGILHTDIGPDNVLWDGKQSYLIDFEESKLIRSPISIANSPDIIGGPPCCWGDIGFGYNTYSCLDALRAWLLKEEFLDLKHRVSQIGAWTPYSLGNTCQPWTTRDDGSPYQTITFGNGEVSGQRDPELRFRYLSTSKRISFAGKKVLDIGCNFGRLGAFLEKFDITLYVGLDIAREYINVASEMAKLEGRRNSTFVVGDICNNETMDILRTSSPSGYDVVICQSVYHHFVDKDKFWKQFSTLGSRWLIFEGPTDDPTCMLTGSWEGEKGFIRGKGYKTVFESYENDFSGRVLALFERTSHDT